jgi:hypothetical protein
MIKTFLLLSLVILSGCASVFGSDEVPDPVGIGNDVNELKRSPCSCIELQQVYPKNLTRLG